jgi:hypothetical protein
MPKSLTDVFDEFNDEKKKDEKKSEEPKESESTEKPKEEEKPVEESPSDKKEETEEKPTKKEKEEEKPPEKEVETSPKKDTGDSAPASEPEKPPLASPKEMPEEYKKYDFTPAKKSQKHTVVVYGLKGAGKSTLSLSAPGTHFCLTFDNKTQAVAGESPNPERIVVHDGVKYYHKGSAEQWLESSVESWEYIQGLLDALENGWLHDENGKVLERPDWILVDGGEIVHTMLEMVMRAINNLMPVQGISNRNIWKERRMYISELFQRCMQIANKGVFWTSYIQKDEIKDEGDFVSIQDVPKWIDAVLYETDVLIKVIRKTGKSGQEFGAIVESSKWKAIPESGYTDVTNTGMKKLIKDMDLFNGVVKKDD